MKIKDSVWCFESEIQLFKGFTLPVRSTILGLQTGESVMISPIKFNETDWADIQNNLRVSHIVAPCDLHHLYVNKAKEKLPQAKLWASRGLIEKRSDVVWDFELVPKNWSLSEDIEIFPLVGNNTNEVVFYHKKSKTLVVTDLIFNMHDRKGWKNFVIQKLFGTWNKPAVSRWFKITIKNKKDFRHVALRLLALEIETLVMAHGDVISKNAKSVLENALRERKLV